MESQDEVSSLVQLVLTETRFQKCSQSGKNVINIYGLLCYFMQKNQKKHSKNKNRRFYYENSAPELKNDEKYHKEEITLSRFAQFFL